jgi:hypothetical protein
MLDSAEIMHAVGLTPDDWQSELLRSTSDRILLLASRQVGKSTSVALLALHTAYFNPGALVLLLAPTERQSALLYEKVGTFHRQLDVVPAVRELALSIEFENRSKVVALPGNPDGVRGFSSPALIAVDEAAAVDPALWRAIFPMVLNGGRMLLLGTPKGKFGRFYELWSSPSPEWHRIKAVVTDLARYTPERLEKMRADAKDEQDWMQEFGCEFLEADGQVFTEEAIQRLLEIDPPEYALAALDLEGLWHEYLRRR